MLGQGCLLAAIDIHIYGWYSVINWFVKVYGCFIKKKDAKKDESVENQLTGHSPTFINPTKVIKGFFSFFLFEKFKVKSSSKTLEVHFFRRSHSI